MDILDLHNAVQTSISHTAKQLDCCTGLLVFAKFILKLACSQADGEAPPLGALHLALVSLLLASPANYCCVLT